MHLLPATHRPVGVFETFTTAKATVMYTMQQQCTDGLLPGGASETWQEAHHYHVHPLLVAMPAAGT